MIALATGQCAAPTEAPRPDVSVPIPSATPVVITGVTVVPMDAERVLPGHSVVIRDGRIEAMGPDGTVATPEGAERIDGAGRWLLPGMVDFHTHERAPGNWPDDVDGNFLMYLANGITTIVNQGDFTGAMIAAGARVRNGTVPGPEVYAGYFARGPGDGGTIGQLASTAEGGQLLTRRARVEGYDFVKTYDRVTREAFDAIVAESEVQGLAVMGHIPAAVGIEGVLGAGMDMMVHAGGVVGAVFGSQFDASRLPSVGSRLASSGVMMGTTLHVMAIIRDFGLDAIAGIDPNLRAQSQPGVEFMDDAALAAWRVMMAQRADIRSAVDSRNWYQSLLQFVRAMHEAGVPLVLGTDVIGIPGVVPGFSLHAELAELRAAGLSPYVVLAAGTRNAGVLLRKMRPAEQVGVIAVGWRADLVLLDGNPLNDLETLRRPVAVVAAGRVYPGSWLTAQLVRLREER